MVSGVLRSQAKKTNVARPVVSKHDTWRPISCAISANPWSAFGLAKLIISEISAFRY